MSYIELRSGDTFHFGTLSCGSGEYQIEDIAFALSNVCRYAGHVNFYSVAEHSVLVSEQLPKRLKLAGLLHDASEAYLGDITAPLKQLLNEYRWRESMLQAAIELQFGLNLTREQHAQVKAADRAAMKLEAQCLVSSCGKDWDCLKGVKKAKGEINLWIASCAYYEFMREYWSLTQ